MGSRFPPSTTLARRSEGKVCQTLRSERFQILVSVSAAEGRTAARQHRARRKAASGVRRNLITECCQWRLVHDCPRMLIPRDGLRGQKLSSVLHSRVTARFGYVDPPARSAERQPGHGGRAMGERAARRSGGRRITLCMISSRFHQCAIMRIDR